MNSVITIAKEVYIALFRDIAVFVYREWSLSVHSPLTKKKEIYRLDINW